MLDTSQQVVSPAKNTSRGNLTKPAAVYRHVNAAGETLYIGCTANPFARLECHIGNSDWSRQVACVQIEWFPSRKEAYAAEARMIRDEAPPFNGIARQPKATHGPCTALADYLAASGLSKQDAAATFGVARSYLYGLMDGSRCPSPEVAQRIEDLTGGTVPVTSWRNIRAVLDAVRGAA